MTNTPEPIGSIDDELSKCQQAHDLYPDAEWFWCYHHAIHFEQAVNHFKTRIDYILNNKSIHEQAIRFRNLRPVKNPIQILAIISGDLDGEDIACKLHDQEWPDNTWDGKSIFAEQFFRNPFLV